MRGFYGSGFASRKIPLKSDGEGDASCSLPAFWFVYSSFYSLFFFPPSSTSEEIQPHTFRGAGCRPRRCACGGGVVSPAPAAVKGGCTACLSSLHSAPSSEKHQLVKERRLRQPPTPRLVSISTSLFGFICSPTLISRLHHFLL